MNDAPDPSIEQPRLAQTFAEVEDALLSRWPETKLEPSLDRIRAFTELLGDPQRGYPVIQLTGTNGKTSTSRMIDTLLRALDLRTGRFTSPHLERMNERICIDGEPLTDEEFVRAFNDVAPYTHLVDGSQPQPLSFFETIVAMAYAAFADAPVDVAVVEVGMGGTWDATNVADAQVAVVTPIGVDHANYLGDTPEVIAVEKAGIIKPGSTAVLAEQLPGPAEVLLARVEEVGASVVREGLDFSVAARVPAVGGQLLSLQGLRARYDDVFLPLYGAHQAQNAATALGGGRGVRGRRAPRRGPRARGVRPRVLARPARGDPAQPDDPARRRAQPARRTGDRRGARGLLRVLPADRRDRRDDGQGRRRDARRPRAASGARRLYPELHDARPAGPPAGRGGARGLRAPTG